MVCGTRMIWSTLFRSSAASSLSQAILEQRVRELEPVAEGGASMRVVPLVDVVNGEEGEWRVETRRRHTILDLCEKRPCKCGVFLRFGGDCS